MVHDSGRNRRTESCMGRYPAQECRPSGCHHLGYVRARRHAVRVNPLGWASRACDSDGHDADQHKWPRADRGPMSAPWTPAAPPRIAVGPRPADFAVEAIRRGGGEVVTLDRNPVGLVWTDARTEDLRQVLAEHPGLVWVQLPQAGVETVVEAGVID